jgi:hypothetical protein
MAARRRFDLAQIFLTATYRSLTRQRRCIFKDVKQRMRRHSNLDVLGDLPSQRRKIAAA